MFLFFLFFNAALKHFYYIYFTFMTLIIFLLNSGYPTFYKGTFIHQHPKKKKKRKETPEGSVIPKSHQDWSHLSIFMIIALEKASVMSNMNEEADPEWTLCPQNPCTLLLPELVSLNNKLMTASSVYEYCIGHTIMSTISNSLISRH